MKFDQLIHFLEAAKYEHIGKAASILRTSPSGISYSIECLEEDLGTKLFEKRGKRIHLTESGHRLMEKIPELQSNLAQLRSFVTAKKPSIFKGNYRLGASHVLAEHFLAAISGNLFSGSDQLTVELYSLRSAEVIKHVFDDKLDLGVCFSPQAHPQMEIRRICGGRIKIYVNAKHPLLKSKKPLQKLSTYSAILPKAFEGIDVCQSDPVFVEHNIKPNIQFAFDDYQVGASLAANSECWGFFPDWMESVPGFPLKAITLPESWDAHYDISAVWRKNRFLDAGVSRLIDALMEIQK